MLVAREALGMKMNKSKQGRNDIRQDRLTAESDTFRTELDECDRRRVRPLGEVASPVLTSEAPATRHALKAVAEFSSRFQR